MKSTQCHSSYDIFCQTQFQKCQSKLCTQITSSQIRNQLSNLQQLTLEVTDSCNLNCRYCGYGSYYSGYEERRNTFLSTRTVKKLLDYLTECWSSSANNSTRRTTTISFYGGEPLLNFKTIREVVDYSSSIQSNQVSFKYSMTTNAILLEKYMDYLVEKDFSLLISLDGNEYNHSYRVTKRDTNSFTKVLKNVKLLRSKYPVFYDKKVNFNAVLTNRSSVNEVYTFFKEELDKRPMLSELNTTGIVPEMKAEFIRTYRNLTESLHQAENYDIILKDLFTHTPDLKSLAL